MNLFNTQELLSVKEAAEWAAKYLRKNVTASNISYLIQYGRISKFGDNGAAMVSKQELMEYYKSYKDERETSWNRQTGEELNWALSFEQYKVLNRTGKDKDAYSEMFFSFKK